MSHYRSPQTPGIDLQSTGLTAGELATVQNITNLGDPNAPRILYWNDSLNQWKFLQIGTNLSINQTTNTLDSAGMGGGDMLSTNNLSELTNFATARTNLGLGGLAVLNTATIATGGTGATTAAGARTALGVDPAGTDNSIPVTLAAGFPSYVSLIGQQLTFTAIDLASAQITGITAVVNGGTGASTAATARTNLGLGSAAIANTTDGITEGTTNLYFTTARVLATVLTGLSTATNAVITATDTILVAMGKLQAQITGYAAQALQFTNKRYTMSTNAQTGTSYTLVVGDASKEVTMNNASANTLTVPNSVFSQGDTVMVSMIGAGVTTITAGAGTTMTDATGGDGVALSTTKPSRVIYFTGASTFRVY